MLPAVAVLENVSGIGRGRYLQKVWARLASLRWFEVLTVRINPKDMGEPVHRPRLFFICVRVDVARDNLDNRVKELLSAGLSAERCSLSARLLPNTSALLQTEASATTRGAARAGALASWRVADRMPASVGRSPTLREETVYRAAMSSPRGW